jgi:hypothetical protein
VEVTLVAVFSPLQTACFPLVTLFHYFARTARAIAVIRQPVVVGAVIYPNLARALARLTGAIVGAVKIILTAFLIVERLVKLILRE